MYSSKIEIDVEALAMTLEDFDSPSLAVMVRDWGRNMEMMDSQINNQRATIRELRDEDVFKGEAIVDLQDEVTALNRLTDDAEPVEMPSFFEDVMVDTADDTGYDIMDELIAGAEEMQWLDDMDAMEDEVEAILALFFGTDVIALPHTDEVGNIYPPQEDFYSQRGM